MLPTHCEANVLYYLKLLLVFSWPSGIHIMDAVITTVNVQKSDLSRASGADWARHRNSQVALKIQGHKAQIVVDTRQVICILFGSIISLTLTDLISKLNIYYGVQCNWVLDKRNLGRLRIVFTDLDSSSRTVSRHLYHFRCWAGSAGFDHRYEQHFTAQGVIY
uniref:DUF4283 domain-containing protein n=1 Tax=Heterorhabditis bacteriophora TaxID=37862 RepID=A0A1I7X241_HETBA